MLKELKNNNDSVLKAKQESFRLMNDESIRKQKLIDDQTDVIKGLKDKMEELEEAHSASRTELEKRLSEKEADLQLKIAAFEANLYEGKQYFEETLAEKDRQLREKIAELKLLKQKYEEPQDNEAVELAPRATNDVSLAKIESDGMRNIKALYEHQIELLKVKIEMLEKACNNYQQGIKEMNKSFGWEISFSI